MEIDLKDVGEIKKMTLGIAKKRLCKPRLHPYSNGPAPSFNNPAHSFKQASPPHGKERGISSLYE
jgi:hypothetical protein